MNILNVTPSFAGNNIEITAEFKPNQIGQRVLGTDSLVYSVNGKNKVVTLGAGDIGFDSSETFPAGSVGAVIDGMNAVRTVTLASGSWTDKQQTVTVTGVKADETKQLLHIIPASASKDLFVASGVMGVAQAADSVTFECVHVPTNNLTVYVLLTEVEA